MFSLILREIFSFFLYTYIPRHFYLKWSGHMTPADHVLQRESAKKCFNNTFAMYLFNRKNQLMGA